MDVEQSNGQPANVINFFFDMSVLEKCIITRSAQDTCPVPPGESERLLGLASGAESMEVRRRPRGYSPSPSESLVRFGSVSCPLRVFSA